MASRAKCFQHPTTQVAKHFEYQVDQEHTDFDVFTVPSYCERDLIVTNVSVDDVHVSLVNTYIYRITTYFVQDCV